MNRYLLLVLVGSTFSLAGCAATEPFELNFPSQDTFIRSETAEVFSIPIADGNRDVCPGLLRDVDLGALVAPSTTGQQTVCEFRAGRVSVGDVPEGPVAYVSVVSGSSGSILLTGCTVRDVYTDPEPLTITLTPTSTYRDLYPADTAAETCTVETKCQLGC